MTPDAYAYHRSRLEPLFAGFRMTPAHGVCITDIVLLALARRDIRISPATPDQVRNGAAPGNSMMGKPAPVCDPAKLA